MIATLTNSFILAAAAFSACPSESNVDCLWAAERGLFEALDTAPDTDPSIIPVNWFGCTLRGVVAGGQIFAGLPDGEEEIDPGTGQPSRLLRLPA